MGRGRQFWPDNELVALMNPVAWSRTIVDYLERIGIVGSILPRGASEATDRYQPNRVFVSYVWSGQVSAATLITFKIRAPEDREDVALVSAGWTVLSRPALDTWGDQWEDIAIQVSSGPALERSEEFHAPGRFHIRVSITDQRMEEDIFCRRIVLENLRETGGVLHAVRIHQSNLPPLHQLRPYGIGEDIYYRAGGLVGSLSSTGRELTFGPYALLPEPVKRPVPGPSLDEAVQQGILAPQIADLLRERHITDLWQFQAQSMSDIRRWLSARPEEEAILLTGGTAAGKTEAFLMPLLETLIEDRVHLGLKGLFVYPTKALEGDQAQRFFEYLTSFNQEREHPISIGVLDGDTSWNFEALAQQEQRGELRTPFSHCPKCGARVTFANDSVQPSPRCSGCGATFPWLRVHRKDIQDFWPHLLLTVPDMLHRQLSSDFAWSNQAMMGREAHPCTVCGKYTPATHKTLAGRRSCSCGRLLSSVISLCPSIIVFDEAHLLKGLFGSQVAILISRIKQIARHHNHHPTIVGASATIANPGDFGRQLFGGPVRIITGQEEFQQTEQPTRHHLFLMPVQVTVLNAVGHILAGCFLADQLAGETNRVLVFSDSKRTVYQLEASLPEFYATLPRTILPNGSAGVPTRSHTGDHGPEERRRVESAFDRGELRVLLATQTLEVGVDFRNLQLEIQTGATYSYNDYIQRVGRAGRRGVEALVICVLRPQVPLDYYYFEHCRELVQFSPETLDEIPIRTDNPFLAERHVPAAMQDYLIGAELGARLIWFAADAARVITDGRKVVEAYLTETFVRPHSWDVDLIHSGIERGIERTLGVLTSHSVSGGTAERLQRLIPLSIRGTEVGVGIESEDFDQHRGISLSGELTGEELVDVGGPEGDEEVDQE